MADEPDLKRDKELADAVRKAARNLCAALDAAGEVALDLSCSVSPHSTQIFADGIKAQTDWQPAVSVRRIQRV